MSRAWSLLPVRGITLNRIHWVILASAAESGSNDGYYEIKWTIIYNFSYRIAENRYFYTFTVTAFSWSFGGLEKCNERPI